MGHKGSTCVYILQLGVQRGASIGECPIFKKNIHDGPIKMAPPPPKKIKNKKCEHTLELILMMKNFKRTDV